MTHPLRDLATALDRRLARKRQMRHLADVQSDWHLAQDLGLPYRPHRRTRLF